MSPATLLADLGDESGISLSKPSVAWDARGGRFLVMWSENTLGGAFYGAPQRVFGRFVDTDGTGIGPAFRVGEGSAGPLVANPVTGEFAFMNGTSLVRVSGDGVITGTTAVVEPRLAFIPQWGTALAVNGRTGDYVAVWTTPSDAGGYEIFARRIPADGSAPDAVSRLSSDGATGPEPGSPGNPAIAWNEADDEYMVVWRARSEIRARRLGADAAPLGDERSISAPGAAPARLAGGPAVTYVGRSGDYLVAWPGGSWPGGEALIQRLQPDGTEAGTDDLAITALGSAGDPARSVQTVSVAAASRSGEVLVTADGGLDTDVRVTATAVAGATPAGPTIEVSDTPVTDERTRVSTVAYDPVSNRYLVAWIAWPGEYSNWYLWERLYIRVLSGGAVSEPSAARCKTLPPAPVSEQPAGRVRLTEAQLRTNRRIALAALRRAQGVQAWLSAGVQSRDLCQAALGPAKFRTGTVTGYTGVAATFGDPDPRPVAIPPAVAEAPGAIRLTAARLLADQRIAQAALRRVAAVEARLDAGLTGADIADGAVGRAQLVSGFRPLYVPAGPSEATGTAATVRTPAEPRRVRVTTAQMRINQRIARAALLRAEALIRRLEDGIGPDEIRDGSLGAEDLAPGVAVSTIP
ncbi:MAG: hypothetical protein U0237_18115 [Thermoleophilia bacterium]